MAVVKSAGNLQYAGGIDTITPLLKKAKKAEEKEPGTWSPFTLPLTVRGTKWLIEELDSDKKRFNEAHGEFVALLGKFKNGTIGEKELLAELKNRKIAHAGGVVLSPFIAVFLGYVAGEGYMGSPLGKEVAALPVALTLAVSASLLGVLAAVDELKQSAKVSSDINIVHAFTSLPKDDFAKLIQHELKFRETVNGRLDDYRAKLVAHQEALEKK